MFVSPFTVSIVCDVAIIILFLQRPKEFGGTPWFGILDGAGFAEELVDVVWLAMIRIAFLLPHVLGFLKRRRLSCPGFHHTFVVANFFFVGVKAVWVVLSLPDNQVSVLWWLLLLLSAVSIIAQRGCLHHLRSSMPRPRYKTIFIGSRLDARLLGDQYDSGTGSEDDDDDYEDEYSSAEESGRSDVESSGLGTRSGGGNRGGGGGGSEEAKGSLGRVMGAGRNWTPKSKGERQRSLSRSAIPGGGKRRGRRRRRRKRSRSRSSRQESTRELVDFFAHRMQEARDAWSGRVSALQKRWQASFLSGDAWGMRGGGSPAADRDAALRLTFGLIVRMYAYENTLEDLRLAAEEDPVCLEAFAPQFASFLVWDSYYMSGQVEAWLLDRCSENLYFAHALEFQLRASCLPASSSSSSSATAGVSSAAAAPGADGTGGAAATSSMSPGRQGGRSSSSGSRRNSGIGGSGGSSSSSDLRKSVLEGAGLVGDGGGDGGGDGDVDAGVDKLARRAVELLLKDIAENGERAARRLVAGEAGRIGGGVGAGTGGGSAEGVDDGGNGSYGSMRTTAMAAVAGGDTRITAGDQAGTGMDSGGGEGSGGVGEGEKQAPFLYRQTIDFLASLADIASSLTPLSKSERTPLLKEKLSEVGKEFLGSGTTAGGGGGGSSGSPSAGNSVERLVYVPVGNRHHRIVAVHPSESFAFSTRERAPCFVCLEVVGAKEPPAGRRKGRRRRGRGQSDLSDDDGREDQGEEAGREEAGDDEQGGAGAGGRGNVLSRRMQALRQWLPRGVSFQQKFRFSGTRGGGGGPGGDGKGWTLSLGGGGDDDDDAELGAAAGPVGREQEGHDDRGMLSTSGTRRASPSASEDLEEGGGDSFSSAGRVVAGGDEGVGRGGAPRMKDGRSRGRGRGSGGVGVGGSGSGSGSGGGARGYDPDDDHYRLLMEEGGEGSDGASGVVPLSSMSDAREWWTESSTGTGKPWGGEDDVGDDDLADVPERRLRLSKASPPGGDSSAAFSRRMDAAATTMDSGGKAPAGGGGGGGGAGGGGQGSDDGRGVCRKCGAESGRPCRPGCRASSAADWGGERREGARGDAGAAGGGDGGGGAPRPQVLFNELWHDKSNRIRRVSPWADEPGWRLLPVIVKSNDDLRQEQLASQLLFVMQRILRAEGVRAWLRPYDIVALSADTGIIEAVPDTISLDALRSLTGFFEARFGAKGSEGFRQAQRRFIESLAAYSIACYLLQIKDRHNGNILLDSQGRVIHIDFGFILANSPGGNLGFESAPFKLTQGFLNLMGGTQSRCFREFRGLCVDTFLALRRSSQEIVLLVEMMASGNESLPCFQGPGGGAAAAADLAARFQPELNDPACQDFVHKLVQQSAGSWTTAWYDKYQRFWSGIY